MTPALAAEDLAVDRQLAEIAESFRFLLDLTPVNVVDARTSFLASTRDEPEFQYRPLDDNPAVLRAEIDAVDVVSVSDHTLSHLVHAKRRELDLQIEMLAARGSSEFCALSIELYGAVTASLLDQAEEILWSVERVPASNGECLDAEQFVRLAERELDQYRVVDPDLSVHAEIKLDVGSVMVVDGDLLVPPDLQVSRSRATALLHHEVGTHVLTYVNGCRQPIRLLAAGLAGYEETQEGLALLAERISGAFGPARLRQIAARVVAVHRMVEGAAFRDVHDELVAAGFSPEGAFGITMRVFRSGGLTKDLVYLRGLVDLVDHVRSGRSLDVLWLGKMPLAAAALVEELRERGVLAEPLLWPRCLADPRAADRLADLERAETVLDLIEG